MSFSDILRPPAAVSAVDRSEARTLPAQITARLHQPDAYFHGLHGRKDGFPMSLTSHLHDKTSPVGQFLRERFAQTASITKETNPLLRSAPCIQPPVVASEVYPYGTIGHAIDYRIRYSFAITPSRDMVAYHGANALANLVGDGSSTNLDEFFTTMLILDLFFDAVDADVSRLQPVGRTLPMDAERRLARYCYVLGMFEEVFRSGVPSERLLTAVEKWSNQPFELVEANQSRFISALLALPKDTWADDIGEMAGLFVKRGQHLFKQQAILNPTFAGSLDVGGADADLIVNGCLIDIKSSKLPGIDPLDLRQLVGYVLLDYDDEFHMQSVGIYKARYGMLVTWPLEQFLSRLDGDTSVSIPSLRREFRQLCQCSAQ